VTAEQHRNWCQEVVQNYDEDPGLDEEVIVKAKATGTYVALSDACELFMAYNDRLSGDGNENVPQRRQLRSRLPDVANVVHVADDFGQPPCDISAFSNRAAHRGDITFVLLQLFTHCRALHRAFLKQKWALLAGPDENMKKLDWLISKIHSGAA
jgi:hypothetical protein